MALTLALSRGSGEGTAHRSRRTVIGMAVSSPIGGVLHKSYEQNSIVD